MNRNDPVQVDAFTVLISNNFELRMLHAQALSSLADLAVHNKLSSRHDALLHVEEIEPSECDTRRVRKIFSF